MLGFVEFEQQFHMFKAIVHMPDQFGFHVIEALRQFVLRIVNAFIRGQDGLINAFVRMDGRYERAYKSQYRKGDADNQRQNLRICQGFLLA